MSAADRATPLAVTAHFVPQVGLPPPPGDAIVCLAVGGIRRVACDPRSKHDVLRAGRGVFAEVHAEMVFAVGICLTEAKRVRLTS